MSNDDILHEIRKIHQWKLDRESLETGEGESYTRFLQKLNPRRWLPEKDKDVAEYFNSSLQWQFAVSDSERTLLAVLQDKFLEIRHKRDEYETPIARTTIVIDEHPNWRKLSWSYDGILLAIASSCGEIKCYDALLNLICSIPKVDDNDSNSLIPNGAIVSLLLIEKRTRSAQWPYELLALEYGGNLRSYFVSPSQGYKPYHTFSFCDTILTSASYVSLFNILIVAFPVTNLNQKSPDDTLGLSTWRLLNDYPYYRLVKPGIENLHVSKANSRWISYLISNKKRTVILKMSASTSGQFLACIHSCGGISLWLIPQMTLHRIWRQQDLPRYQINNETLPAAVNNEFYPLDINWCSDKKFVLITRNGSLTVSSMDTLDNLLSIINAKSHSVDRQPKQVNVPAKLANSCDIDSGFLVLECKIKLCSARRDSEFARSQEDESSLSTAVEVADNSPLRQFLKFFIYFEFFQQQKKILYVEKNYALTFLKQVTPQELYSKKINCGEYEEALEFARLFKLDENRVYKKQWESNPVTTESIKNYLAKVSDKWWIINECCQRIPENLSAAKTLLKYGLQLTGFDVFVDYHDVPEPNENDIIIADELKSFTFNPEHADDNFSTSQLLLFQLRKYLLLCYDALNIYEKILELNPIATYIEEMYRKFRTNSTLNLALYYAHDGNVRAVEVLLTYHGETLLPYWLRILDDIPESISPIHYKKLLPRINEHQKLENWRCKRIREADWSESGNFKNLMRKKPDKHGDHIHSQQYPFTYKVLASWYENKIRKVVEQSGLVDNALELLNIARQNGINSLDYLQHNLLVLDTVMYELMIEDEVSLIQIEAYSEIDKLMLLMPKSNCEETFLEDVSNILLPFLNRCESLYPNSRDDILDEYFKRLSENDLSLPFIFFTYVAETDEVDVMFSDKRKLELGLLSVYSCKRVDQIDLAMRIVQCLPHVAVTDNNNIDYEELFVLNSRVNELQYELEVLQLLRSYGIEKNVETLHTNKTNVQFQKNVLSEMVHAKIDKINSKGFSKNDMYGLLDDMRYLQQFYVSLHDQTYLKIFAYTMLTANRNDCVEEYAPLVLTCSVSQRQKNPMHKISYDESVTILVEAAQYYFNIASSYDDPCIVLAKLCLSLVEEYHAQVEKEKKLINALRELNAFGVFIPPLKVRMSIDKVRIIEKVLRHTPKAYKKIEKLISLANNLDLDGNCEKSLEYEVLNCAIDVAFQLKDFEWCSKIVGRLVESDHPCWEVCKRLCESEEYNDLETKQNLIKFAILQCNAKELSILVELRNEIERKILREKLQNTIQQLKDGERNDGDESSRISDECAATDNPLQTIENLHNLISISSLANILQSSSANVLNVDFWKNTFNFRQGFDRDEIEFKGNTDFNKLGYPEFYKSLHEHTGCTCSSGQSPIENEKQVFQLLLRYYLLSSRKDSDTDDLLLININDVISQLAVTIFPNDCMSSLCLMLLLNNETYSEKVIGSFPPTDAVEKFALYYYSLKLAQSCEIKDVIGTESPSMLISKVLSAVKESSSSYAKLFKKYQKCLEKRRGITKLRDLGCGIDSVRFFNDETYKVDSILGVAMYEERDKLDLALALGNEYDVCKEDVVLSHITSLFLSRNLTLLTERLKEPMILEILKKKSSYVTQRIVSDIYDGLNGCDYQVLLLYYALLNQIAENEIIHHLRPKDHMKLLRKLKSFSKSIDYKLLTNEQPKLVEAMMPAVFGNEISHIENFLFALPAELKQLVNFEEILEQLAEKIFFNGPANLSYLRRFDLSCPFLKRIPEVGIGKVMQKFLFSKHSCENIENDERRQLLEAAIGCFSDKMESFGSVVEYLKNYSKQFEKIDELNEICRAIDISEGYLRELQSAFIHNDDTDLKRIILKMILDATISADTIKVILEFVRMDCLTDIISELLNGELNKNTVEPLVQRIENCLEDNEYEKCWCAPLKWFLNDKTISENTKIKIENILSILEESEDDIYKTIELLHETRLILREWVAIQSLITLFDVSTETTRLKLVKELLKLVNSSSQIRSLQKLLQFWPPFEDTNDWKNDPWMLLLENILQVEKINENEEIKIMEKIIAKRKLTKEMGRSFFEHVTNLPHNEILLVWFCVLSRDELLIQSVNGYISELRQDGKMPKLIETCLKQLEC